MFSNSTILLLTAFFFSQFYSLAVFPSMLPPPVLAKIKRNIYYINKQKTPKNPWINPTNLLPQDRTVAI